MIADKYIQYDRQKHSQGYINTSFNRTKSDLFGTDGTYYCNVQRKKNDENKFMYSFTVLDVLKKIE